MKSPKRILINNGFAPFRKASPFKRGRFSKPSRRGFAITKIKDSYVIYWVGQKPVHPSQLIGTKMLKLVGKTLAANGYFVRFASLDPSSDAEQVFSVVAQKKIF